MIRLTNPSRLILAVALSVAAPAAQAADPPALRGDITALRDVLTLGDLVDRVPERLAGTPLFRAPALGQTGTIQTKRIAAAAEALGVGPVETGGRMQVGITRAARHVGSSEIEAAIRTVLAKDHGMDPAATGIAFDAPIPAFVVGPDLTGAVVASDVTVDRRSRRVGAVVWIGPSAQERRAQLRVSGTAIDLVEVLVAGRAVERGQAVRASDISVERRARDLVAGDAAYDGLPVEGRIARRTFGAGSVVRPSDLVRPEIVGRGDLVTVVYDTPGVSLSLRAQTTAAGALGDTVTVVNPQSKKTLQGIVIGPGRVSVSTAPTGRLAAAAAPSP